MEIVFYFLTGAFAGLLSGMFGVGGGIVVVPILALLFGTLHFPPGHIMHLALGTSVATIIINSISSSHGHHQHGNVNWRIVRDMAPAGIIGAVLGTWLAAHMQTEGLKLIFAIFECSVATHLLLNGQPHSSRTLPGDAGLFSFGGGVGLLSSLLGIGGGTVSVPVLLYWNCAMRQAIGTAAAIGLPLSIVGTLGYVIAGLHANGLPAMSFGFIYLPAFLGIALAGMLSAPLGVKLAQRLPVALLKKLLALLLYVLGLKMGWGLL